MSKESKTKWIIKIAFAAILLLLILAPKCAKAEGEPIMFTPDPNGSWDDYISANPLPTIAPSPTPEPTEEPTRTPFILAGTQPYQDSYIRAYRLAPEIENGQTVLYYQKLTSPFSLVNSVPGQVAISRTTNQNWNNYSTEGASGGLPYVLNKQNSLINLVDNYICLQWNINFASSQAVGSGLNYGYDADFVFAWTMSAYVASTGERVNNLPVYCRVQTVLDNNVVFIQSWQTNTTDLAYGTKFTVKSDQTDRKVYSVRCYFYIGMTEDTYNNLSNDNVRGANDRVYYLVASGKQQMNVNTHEGIWNLPPQILAEIQNTRVGILGGISSLFHPTQAAVQQWINNHTSNQLMNASPVNRYWEAYLSLCNKM